MSKYLLSIALFFVLLLLRCHHRPLFPLFLYSDNSIQDPARL